MKQIEFYNPYHDRKIEDVAPAQTTYCGSKTSSAACMVIEKCGGGTMNDIGCNEVKILDEQNGYIRDDGTVGTITTDGSSPKHNNRVIEDNIRIRKLTPKECWRLMDFTDEQFDKAREVNSDSQLYKQAGNSIVVNVLYHIFKQMLEKCE